LLGAGDQRDVEALMAENPAERQAQAHTGRDESDGGHA